MKDWKDNYQFFIKDYLYRLETNDNRSVISSCQVGGIVAQISGLHKYKCLIP